jgi:hypothetical protein
MVETQMKKINIKLFCYLLVFFMSIPTYSKDEKDNKNKTNLTFEELLVHGKYHFSDEAVTTVEDDKILDALLPVRKDFKDRIQKNAKRY